MTTEMQPLDEPPRQRRTYSNLPLEEVTFTLFPKEDSVRIWWGPPPVEWEELQSLSSVKGLEPLAEVCRRHDVHLTAGGSLVRRLILSPGASVFEASRCLSDLDLVHSGSPDQTEGIKTAILTEIPFGEALRVQLRSETEDEVFRSAAAHSGIIPVATMRLSTDRGLKNPWCGVDDILNERYRYIKNGFFTDSPLYQGGRDLDVLSSLLYFRIILESVTSSVTNQPGLRDALRVVDETVASGDALDRVHRNPDLCARLVYFLAGIKATRPAQVHVDNDVYAELGLDRLSAYFSGHATLRDAFHNFFRPLTGGSSLVVSAHVAGAQFRFDLRPQLPWTPVADEVWEQLSAAVDAFRSGSAALTPLAASVDNGLVAVAASPILPIRAGRSRSSGTADGPAGVHEFVHFIVTFDPLVDLGVSDAPEDLSVIVAVNDHRKVRWVTTVPSYCHLEKHKDGTFLFVRCNLGGICEAVTDGALQVFVLGWKGRKTELRRL